MTLFWTVASGCAVAHPEDGETDRTSIAALLGQDAGYSEDHWRDQEAQIQDLVAACMAEQGWEYIPINYPDTFYDYGASDGLEIRRREGYGIAYSTLNLQSEEVSVDPLADWVDPNQAFMDSLTDKEREAYFASLYGTPEEQNAITTTEVDPTTGDEYQTTAGYGAGCQGEASEEVYGSEQSRNQVIWDAASQYYDELEIRVQADPRMKALGNAWVACMRQAGYDYTSPNDIWETAYPELQARHDEIVGNDFYADPMEGWTEEERQEFWATATEAQINEMLTFSPELTADQRTALEALLDDEIDLAVAEWQCTEPFQKQSQELSAQIEEEYAIEHRDEIEELAASLSGGH